MRQIIFLMVIVLFSASSLFAAGGVHTWVSTGSGFYDTETGNVYVVPEKQKNWVEQQDEYNYKLQHMNKRKD